MPTKIGSVIYHNNKHHKESHHNNTLLNWIHTGAVVLDPKFNFIQSVKITLTLYSIDIYSDT